LKAAAENPAGVLRINGTKGLFVWRAVPGTELLLVRDCPTEAMRRSITVSRIIAGAGIAASAALLFLIIRFATQKMMKRLYIIMDGMKEVREGNLDISLSVEGSDEITGMAQIFTGMVDRIKTLIAEIEREQRLVTDTEIRAMQNQINAHFLYNALETIKMQAELQSHDDIVQSITLLGKMLRYCLRWRSPRVSLGEELEYIRAYIALLNIRHDYTIQIHVHIEESLLDHEIPKMLIQPLVENAFLHAIEPSGEDAWIGISANADREAGILWISVQDSGGGIEAEKQKEIEALLASPPPALPQQDSGGIGLVNIQERLAAFYGPSWKIRIQSGEGKGTEVLIPLPLRPAPCP
jgi:two-component system sensor histidine kinase YesM